MARSARPPAPCSATYVAAGSPADAARARARVLGLLGLLAVSNPKKTERHLGQEAAPAGGGDDGAEPAA